MLDQSIELFQRLRMNSVARDLEDTVPDWKLSYRIDEAVAATGIGRTKLYEIIRAGKLETRRADGMILILRDELQRYLHSLPSTRSP
jgi:excisionase family DNA binding protein